MTQAIQWREVCGERAWRKFKRILGWSRAGTSFGEHCPLLAKAARNGAPPVLPTSRESGEKWGAPRISHFSRKRRRNGAPPRRGDSLQIPLAQNIQVMRDVPGNDERERADSEAVAADDACARPCFLRHVGEERKRCQTHALKFLDVGAP